MNTAPAGTRESKTMIQAVLGVAVFILWVIFDGAISPEDSIAESVVSTAPLLIAYEVGVFSRFLPGLNALARRFR